MESKVFTLPPWLAALALLWPGAGLAEALNQFDGLYMYNDAGATVALPANQLYDRKNWSRLGGVLTITTYHGLGRFYPEAGERWIIRLNDSDSGQALNTLSIDYDAASDCLYSGGSVLMCDITPDQDYVTRHNFITIRYALGCVATRNYDIDITHEYPAGTELVGDSPYAFRPTRFEPKIISTSAPLELEPSVVSGGFGDTGEITVIVYDATNCGRPMRDVEVELTNTVSGESSGHTHFNNAEEEELWGTGTYVAVNGGSDSLSRNGTRITGSTGDFGDFDTAYKAGEFGVVENIDIRARLAATDLEPEALDTAERTIDLRVRGLVEMANNGPDHTFRFGGTCAHSPTATYMVPALRSALLQLAANYHATYNGIISFNDASLAYGGFFENWTGTSGSVTGTGGRESRCHKSHRKGVDIDVNWQVWNPENSNQIVHYFDDYMLVDGEQQLRLNLLTAQACDAGLSKIDEDNIHYRLGGCSPAVVESDGETP